jgi:hypothetical protein
LTRLRRIRFASGNRNPRDQEPDQCPEKGGEERARRYRAGAGLAADEFIERKPGRRAYDYSQNSSQHGCPLLYPERIKIYLLRLDTDECFVNLPVPEHHDGGDAGDSILT